MTSIYRSVLQYRENLAARVSELERALAKSPEGSLTVLKRGTHRYYYHRTYQDGRRVSLYIPKSDQIFIKDLSLKHCASAVLPKLRSNLHAADAFIRLHSGMEEADVTSRIRPEILLNCRQLFPDKEALKAEWLSSKGPEAPFYDDPPTVETADGCKVRSKSEAIIYNSLMRHGAVFLYEKALYLDDLPYPVFPDFTIVDVTTMQEIYWEHFGMMDDPDYLMKTLEKISSYNRNGIIPGRSLFCTFESRLHPLSSAEVENIVCALLAEA